MADEVNENIFLVNAPAGSGKTTWIRQQVESYLLRNPKDNILCITYTNRAAEELGRDLEQSRVYFGTIHSFINDFIGSFFSHKEIIDLYWEVYETQIIERIKNTEQKETWTEGAERYKEKYGSLDLDTVRSNINKISYNETPFNSLLYGGLGHNDLITFTKLAVDRFPIIKKKISDKYQLIFIDEYQDTSAEVLHIFYTSLVGKKSKLYLLGDKMQQIYKNYNGEFEEKLETFNRSVNLSINYRTTPKIVDILNYIYNDEALKQCPYEKNSNDTMACVKNFNEMDTVIEDTVTAKAQSGDIDEMASLFNSVSFRDFVMTGYKQKCAITGNVIQYKSFMNLEAAHIWPRSHKGLYLPSNGIALCRDMHWAFDKGMFTIGDDFKVIVHPDVESDYLQQYNNKSLYIPENAFFRPDINNLHYHQTHIYGLFKTSGSLVKATGYYKNINMAAEDKTPYGSN